MSSDSTEDDGEYDTLTRRSQLAGANSPPITTTYTSKRKRNDAQEMKQGLTSDKDNEKRAGERKGVIGKSDTTSWFAIPPPLKRLFDHFPLVTYSESHLPTRAVKTRRPKNVLHVFTSERDAAYGRPSFNPNCLKWQVRVNVYQ